MRPTFTFSEAVRVVRAIRNDGTYAGLPSGALLVRRGSIGYVRDWGCSCRTRSSTRSTSRTVTGLSAAANRS